MARVVLGVGGGIAAYKVAALLRGLTEAGHTVEVVPTAAALRFVGAPTWEALSGRAIRTDVWSDVPDVPHVHLGQAADLVLVAPATADLLARAAHGLADDLLTNVLLTARCPVLMVPAMHTEMWQHAATAANVATLRARGVHVMEPAVGRLTGADSGPGRMPEPEQIQVVATGLLTAPDLAGRRVVISAGGTQEPLDPVRFLGNRSSGKQGVALAATAAARGAKVTLVAANVAVPIPVGVDVVRVGTAADLHRAMLEQSEGADVVVMAAAVADFRPVRAAEAKIKKSADGSVPQIVLERTADILADLVARRGPDQLIVGFAAETGDACASVLDHGRRKLAAKGVDLLVVNDVSAGRAFGTDTNEAVVLGSDRGETHVPYGEKSAVAAAVWDLVVARLASPTD